MGPPLLKIHHPLDNVSPGAKVMRRGGPLFYRVYIKTLWNRMDSDSLYGKREKLLIFSSIADLQMQMLVCLFVGDQLV